MKRNNDFSFYNTDFNRMANPMGMPMGMPGVSGMDSMQNIPMNMMPNGGMMNQPMMGGAFDTNLEDRITRLERQMRKMEHRLSRLENPYPEAVGYDKKEEFLYNQSIPSDNMHMM